MLQITEIPVIAVGTRNGLTDCEEAGGIFVPRGGLCRIWQNNKHVPNQIKVLTYKLYNVWNWRWRKTLIFFSSKAVFITSVIDFLKLPRFPSLPISRFFKNIERFYFKLKLWYHEQVYFNFGCHIIENIEMLGKAIFPDITPDKIKYRKVALFLVPKCQNHGFFGSEISTEISFGHIFAIWSIYTEFTNFLRNGLKL